MGVPETQETVRRAHARQRFFTRAGVARFAATLLVSAAIGAGCSSARQSAPAW